MTDDKPQRGGKRTPGPGKRIGRPPGSKSAEPTEYVALRIPERTWGPFKARHGTKAAGRIRDFVEVDRLPGDGKKKKT